MDARRGLGAVLLVAGLSMAAVGVAGAFARSSGSGTAGGGSHAPTTAAPSASSGPIGTPASNSPTPASTPASTAAPSDGPDALIRAFFARLEVAIRDGAQETVIANLGGPVIDRYGIGACETTLGARAPSPAQAFEIVSISGPAPWDYTTDGLTTTVPDAYTVQARVTGPNASGEIGTSDAALHVTIAEGTVFWFTDCGEPVGGT